MSTFDLQAQQRKNLFDLTTNLLEDYIANTDKIAVSPSLDQEEIKKEVVYILEEYTGTPPAAIEKLIQSFKKYTVHTPHPMYFGLFNPRANFASILADLISATFNFQMAAWSHAPLAAEIENYLIKELSARFGYTDEADGVFCSGGAEANLTAVLCALNDKIPNYRKNGLIGIKKRPIVYCSDQSHHSVAKAVRNVGLGELSLRSISINESNEIDIEVLKQTIVEDLAAGHQPFMLIGTAGTTGLGAFDKLKSLSSIAKENNLWFHVDAAYGGAISIHPTLRNSLNGIELSDSITFDIHKWLSVPMATSTFLTSNPTILSQTFGIRTDYMPKDGDGLTIVDPFTHSIQWSRRFIGLKLYLSLLFYGWNGFEKLIEDQCVLADYFRKEITARGWEVKNDTMLPIVCFGHKDIVSSDIQKHCKSIVEKGEAWISVYPVHKEMTLRVCITNYNSSKKDIDKLIEIIEHSRLSKLI